MLPTGGLVAKPGGRFILVFTREIIIQGLIKVYCSICCRTVVTSKNLRKGEELFCDYGYLDKYMKLTSVYDTVISIGKFINNNDEQRFKENMKAGIQLVRKYAKDYGDQFKAVGSLINLFAGI
jgi:hypothetical protein